MSVIRKLDVRDPSSGDPMTADERAHLTSGGFDLDKGFHDYGNSDLLRAYRAGFVDGIVDVILQHPPQAERYTECQTRRTP